MRPHLFPVLVLLSAVAPASAEPLVVKDAKTNEIIAEVDPDSGNPIKIGDREVIIARKDICHTEQVARRLRISVVDFQGATIAECLDFLRQRSREIEPIDSDPRMHGLNIRTLNKEVADRTVHRLALRNVSFFHVMTAIAEQTGLTIAWGDESVLFQPAGADKPATKPAGKPTATSIKAKAIEIPNIDLDGAWLAEAVDFLRQRSRELDTTEVDPSMRGLNIRILDPKTSNIEIHELKLRNVSLHHVFTALAEQTGTVVEFGDESILFRPAGPAKGPTVIKPSGATAAKAKVIMVPVIDLQGSTLAEAVDFLRSRSRELDTAELDPKKKGINFRILTEELSETVIHELKLRNVSTHTAITAIAEATGTVVEFGDESVLFKPAAK